MGVRLEGPRPLAQIQEEGRAEEQQHLYQQYYTRNFLRQATPETMRWTHRDDTMDELFPWQIGRRGRWRMPGENYEYVTPEESCLRLDLSVQSILFARGDVEDPLPESIIYGHYVGGRQMNMLLKRAWQNAKKRRMLDTVASGPKGTVAPDVVIELCDVMELMRNNRWHTWTFLRCIIDTPGDGQRAVHRNLVAPDSELMRSVERVHLPTYRRIQRLQQLRPDVYEALQRVDEQMLLLCTENGLSLQSQLRGYRNGAHRTRLYKTGPKKRERLLLAHNATMIKCQHRSNHLAFHRWLGEPPIGDGVLELLDFLACQILREVADGACQARDEKIYDLDPEMSSTRPVYLDEYQLAYQQHKGYRIKKDILFGKDEGIWIEEEENEVDGEEIAINWGKGQRKRKRDRKGEEEDVMKPFMAIVNEQKRIKRARLMNDRQWAVRFARQARENEMRAAQRVQRVQHTF